jgi:predicted RNase H-like HicB family nuclease
MLAGCMDRALEKAVYERMKDGSYWGEVPGMKGAWASRPTLAECRKELREALSDWIALRLRLGLRVPVVQ